MVITILQYSHDGHIARGAVHKRDPDNPYRLPYTYINIYRIYIYIYVTSGPMRFIKPEKYRTVLVHYLARVWHFYFLGGLLHPIRGIHPLVNAPRQSPHRPSIVRTDIEFSCEISEFTRVDRFSAARGSSKTTVPSQPGPCQMLIGGGIHGNELMENPWNIKKCAATTSRI